MKESSQPLSLQAEVEAGHKGVLRPFQDLAGQWLRPVFIQRSRLRRHWRRSNRVVLPEELRAQVQGCRPGSESLVESRSSSLLRLPEKCPALSCRRVGESSPGSARVCLSLVTVNENSVWILWLRQLCFLRL